MTAFPCVIVTCEAWLQAQISYRNYIPSPKALLFLWLERFLKVQPLLNTGNYLAFKGEKTILQTEAEEAGLRPPPAATCISLMGRLVGS